MRFSLQIFPFDANVLLWEHKCRIELRLKIGGHRISILILVIKEIKNRIINEWKV